MPTDVDLRLEDSNKCDSNTVPFLLPATVLVPGAMDPCAYTSAVIISVGVIPLHHSNYRLLMDTVAISGLRTLFAWDLKQLSFSL
jgi:hypothetical protein